MADDAAPKLKRSPASLLIPLAMLLVGAGGGAAGAWFAPTLLAVERPKPKPQVAPLAYVEIDNAFTANLSDSGRFVQLRIAVSTNGGEPVVEAVERHKLAIIAAVIEVLGAATEADLVRTGGRDRLAGAMRRAINDTLQRKAGLGGIDDVYLTSFIIQ